MAAGAPGLSKLSTSTEAAEVEVEEAAMAMEEAVVVDTGMEVVVEEADMAMGEAAAAEEPRQVRRIFFPIFYFQAAKF